MSWFNYFEKNLNKLGLKLIFNNHFNIYFFLPFVIWCGVGIALLYHFDSTFLFAFVNQRNTPFLDIIFERINYVGEGWLIAIILFCTFLYKPFRNPWFFAAAIFATVLPSLITQLIKYYTVAPRPMTVFQHQAWVHHLSHWALLHNNSFPSGHTTGAFSFMCLMACVLPKKHRYFGLIFFILALAVAYARLYLAAHFFVDVFVGSLIGTLISFVTILFVFYFKHRKENQQIA